MFAPNVALALLLGWLPLMVGIPLGIPPGPEDPLLMQVAPEKCFFYTTWAPTAAPDASSGNQTEQLLAEPEVQAALAKLEVEGKRFLTLLGGPEQDRAQALLTQLAPRLARAAITQGGAIYVSHLEFAPAQPPIVRGVALIKLGDQKKDVLGLLRSLEELHPERLEAVKLGGSQFSRVQIAPDAPEAELTWGEWRGALVIGLGKGAVEELLKNAETPTPGWLNEVAEALPIPRRATLAYLNVAGVRDALAKIAGPQGQMMIDAAGLGNLEALSSVSGLDDAGFVASNRLTLSGEPEGLMTALAGEPLTADELRPIPADALVAGALRLNLAELLAKSEEALARVEPRAAQQFRSNLDQMSQMLQVDLERDLLATLGDAWYVYTSPSTGGLLSGWTAAVTVRDARRLQRTHDMLLGLVRGQAGERGPKIRSLSAGDEEVFYLSVPERFPFAPSWSVTKNELVIGLFPQTVVSHITRGKEHKALVEEAFLSDAFGKDSGPIALSYANTQALFDVTYPMLQMGAQLALSQPNLERLPIDISILPPAGAIRRHLGPAVSVTRYTPEGFVSERRQSLPGASLGASAPIATALLLPAVQSAREAARRTQSSNNLKQIGLALHNYHDTYRGFPPAYTTDADGKPLLSWRVYLLPYLEQQALYDQFHFDEPWDSEHNKKLIAQMPAVYRDPNSQAGEGMTVYVAPRGENTVFPEPEQPTPGGRIPTGTRLFDITDGTSNTIAALAVGDQKAVIWTKPDDYEYDPQNPLAGAFGLRPQGLLALFCDGSVRFLAQTLDPNIANALFTRNGGEPVGAF